MNLWRLIDGLQPEKTYTKIKPGKNVTITTETYILATYGAVFDAHGQQWHFVCPTPKQTAYWHLKHLKCDLHAMDDLAPLSGATAALVQVKARVISADSGDDEHVYLYLKLVPRENANTTHQVFVDQQPHPNAETVYGPDEVSMYISLVPLTAAA